MSDEVFCPRCDSEMKTAIWKEDGHVVEVKHSCHCGFVYHWAYGTVYQDGIEGDDDEEGFEEE